MKDLNEMSLEELGEAMLLHYDSIESRIDELKGAGVTGIEYKKVIYK